MHKLKLEAVYTSDIPFFDFDSQMDPWTVARQVVRACFMEMSQTSAAFPVLILLEILIESEFP